MSKNTHLEHLEDSILLDGEQGARDAFMFLDELARVFTGKQKMMIKCSMWQLASFAKHNENAPKKDKIVREA